MEVVSFTLLESYSKEHETSLVIDGRNIYDVEELNEMDIKYMCIGR